MYFLVCCDIGKHSTFLPTMIPHLPHACPPSSAGGLVCFNLGNHCVCVCAQALIWRLLPGMCPIGGSLEVPTTVTAMHVYAMPFPTPHLPALACLTATTTTFREFPTLGEEEEEGGLSLGRKVVVTIVEEEWRCSSPSFYLVIPGGHDDPSRPTFPPSADTCPDLPSLQHLLTPTPAGPSFLPPPHHPYHPILLMTCIDVCIGAGMMMTVCVLWLGSACVWKVMERG